MIPTALIPLFRLSWRHAWRRPLQSLFFIFGVALGVAMMVAIDLANGSAGRAFELGTETVTGRATHQIVGGPSGLDQALYTRLRRELGYRLSAPVVENYVIAQELAAQPMRLLGVDVFADAPFRSYLGAGNQTTAPVPSYLADLMVRPNTALLSSVVAERYNLQLGDKLTIRLGSQTSQLELVGLLAPTDDLSRRALDSLLITDIATAQEVLQRLQKLDRIDLMITEDEAGRAVLEQISAILPPGARIQPVAARSGTVNEMTAAFNLNLTALSLLALVVGMFLIYNTVTFSVVQRRPVLGTLRALGMTRGEIYALILVEAGVLGLIGTLIGLALGIALGRGLVQLVTQTINDLFFVVAVREIDIPWFTLVKGTIIGVGAALLGAAIPAYEATNAAPAGALQRSNIEERARRAIPWVSGGALLLLALGAALLIPEWNLVVAFAGLFAVILGGALLTPLLTLGMMRGTQGMVQSAGVIARMAPRTIVRSLSRTSVAVAALMVAVSVIIGVGVMIGSFRNTVEAWLEDVLQADIFISPPTFNANQVRTTLDNTVLERMKAFPGIIQVASTRGVDVTAFLPPLPPQVGEGTIGSSSEVAGGMESALVANGSSPYQGEVGRGLAVPSLKASPGDEVQPPLPNPPQVGEGTIGSSSEVAGGMESALVANGSSPYQGEVGRGLAVPSLKASPGDEVQPPLPNPPQVGEGTIGSSSEVVGGMESALATNGSSPYQGEVGRGLAVGKEVQIRLIAFSEDLAGPKRRYKAAIGDWQATWQAVVAGGMLINEPMANRLHLGVGDELTVQTDRGLQRFPIVGVAVDFDVNNVGFIHDPVYRRLWDDPAISALALFVAPGVDLDQKVDEIRTAFAGQMELLVRSNRNMRQSALEVFDRTFAITVALQLLATIVAFIGIFSTLMSLQLERSREIGVLRSTGMTRRQLWQLSLLETGLLGACAGLIAMPMGVLLAVILIYIINLRSFGWTLAMQLQPTHFLQALLVALVAALLAGLYPAWRMGQMQPASALRSE